MGLEAGNGFITGLVNTNPVGATDPKSQGDDHLRLIKTALLGSFPNIGGAMTLTHTQLNEAARLSAANLFTNTNTFTVADNVVGLAAVGATGRLKIHGYHAAFLGSFIQVRNAADSADAPLTINASSMAFNATLANFSINGVAASDFARQSQSNTFTNGNVFTLNAGTVFKSTIATAAINNYLSFQDSAAAERAYLGFGIGASSIFSVRNATAGAELRLSTNGGSITLDGVAATDFARLSQANQFTGASQRLIGNTVFLDFWNGANSVNSGFLQINAASDTLLASLVAANGMQFRTNAGAIKFSGDGGSSFHTQLSSAGVLTTPNASASEVGFKGTPPNTQNGNYGIVLADCGGLIRKQSGAGNTITIPANATIPIPEGTIITIDNDSGNPVSIAITTDVLELAGAGTVGTRTLSDNGSCSIQKITTTKWRISGTGLS